MSFLPKGIKSAAVALLLSSAACQPDAPATTQTPPAGQPVEASTVPPPPPAAGPADTLHLPGGQVVRLRPSTAAAFARLPADGLPELDAESPDQNLAATQGRVRRQGLDLLLTPAQGPAVRLSSTPKAKFTLENSAAVRYVYWGSLPEAHQWVVQAWYWESEGTVLVDQRTGRQQLVYGHPAASPDGRYVLATSPGLGGGDQINSLSLVEITPTGPRLRWQREPEQWAPERARWAGPGRVLLQLSHLGPDGQLPDPPRPSYAELLLPAPL